SLASLVGACGGEPGDTNAADDGALVSQSVTGGRDETGYKATGFLRLYDDNGGISGPFCTATLIRSNLILTAAHCPEASFIGSYHVGFSQGGVDSTSYIPVSRFISNPLYPNKGFADGTDVSVGLLGSDVTGVPIATWGDAKVGNGYRYVGYGVVNPGNIKDI